VKKLMLLLLSSLFSSLSWGEAMDDLVERDGIYYKKFSDVPFTGPVEIRNFRGVLHKGYVKNGKSDGPWVAYWLNGQLSSQGNYKKGEKDGPWISYWENGHLWDKGEYKNGKRDGRWVFYHPDGSLNKKSSGVLKNGKKMSD